MSCSESIWWSFQAKKFTSASTALSHCVSSLLHLKTLYGYLEKRCTIWISRPFKDHSMMIIPMGVIGRRTMVWKVSLCTLPGRVVVGYGQVMSLQNPITTIVIEQLQTVCVRDREDKIMKSAQLGNKCTHQPVHLSLFWFSLLHDKMLSRRIH